jgi:hypothetical protein
MPDRYLHYLLLYGVDLLALVLAVLALWRDSPSRSTWHWWAAAFLGLAFIGRTVYFFHTTQDWGCDLRLLWFAGDYALQGKDPYSVKGLLPPNDDLASFINLPSSIPFIKLIALTPLAVAQVFWTSVNVLICLGLGLLTRRALMAQDGEQAPMLSLSMAALLTAPVILSLSANFGMEAGQFVFLVTFALLGALILQGRQPARPASAAAALAFASFKLQTMGPFLLLFWRRRDLRIWLWLCLMGAALLLAAGDPSDLPGKFWASLDANAALRQPGRASDNSMLNPLANCMFGFEHVFYRWGLVHRPTITLLAIALMVGLGIWLALVVNAKPAFPRGACCALVSLSSMLFVYHRLYDLCILIIPLFYCAGRLHAAPRPARWCYAWVVTAVLLALNAPYGEFLRIQVLYSSWALLRIFVLASVTYLILSALVALFVAISLERRQQTRQPALSERREVAVRTAVLAGLAE